MKILLTTLNAKYIHLNLAVRLLYTLNQQHKGLAWKEFTIKENPDAIADYCAQFEVVAFSCYIWNISQTLAVAQALKKRNPKTKVLLGGPEVSYEWEEIINKTAVDYIIVGEGEIPFSRFLDAYPNVAHIPNLVSKNEGEIQYIPSAEIFEVSNYAGINPYLLDHPEELKNKVCYIETSRGCPYKCEFCLASLDNKVRYLPISTLKENLLYLMENAKTIKFLDRTFNMKRDFTLDIFQFILDHHQPHNVFQFEITADILHPDIIQFIAEKVPPGLFRFEIGIQTVNQKANLQVSRKQNFEKTTRIIKAVEHKIELHLDLIVGLALDYWADIQFSFEEVFKLFAPELQLGFLKFLKGTPLREKYATHGFVFDPNPPYQIIRSNYLSEEELDKILKLENVLEIYWNKKRTPNSLKYITQKYSIFNFLVELGAYFESRQPFHQYLLDDIFIILFDFCKDTYPNDTILTELIAIDYYSFHKMKPKPLFLNPLMGTKKHDFIHQNGLNHAQFRFEILPISFNYNHFKTKLEIIASPSTLIFEYNGKEKAILKDYPNFSSPFHSSP